MIAEIVVHMNVEWHVYILAYILVDMCAETLAPPPVKAVVLRIANIPANATIVQTLAKVGAQELATEHANLYLKVEIQFPLNGNNSLTQLLAYEKEKR